MHCIVRYEETKMNFIGSFNVLTKAQLDGRNNPETARPDVWVKIAESYNDTTFNISANRYPQVHSDFDRAIDISYDAVVPSMGKMTAEKAKSKFMEMKNQASIIKAKAEESGGGDGSKEADQDDFVVDDWGDSSWRK